MRVIGDGKPCDKTPRGWWCSRRHAHDGPCAARPRWWNFWSRRPGRFA